MTGKKIKIKWRSTEFTRFTCAHEDVNDMKPCGDGRRGDWTEEDLPEGRHRIWVSGEDEVGNKAKPLSHDWIVGK